MFTAADKHSLYVSALLKNIALGLALGVCAVFSIKIINSGSLNFLEIFQYVSAHTIYVGELKQYGFLDSTNLLNRSSAAVKLIFVGILFLFSELIVGPNSFTRSSSDFDIRAFRAVTFSFLIPLSIYPELMSRVLLFYFGVEIILFCGQL